MRNVLCAPLACQEAFGFTGQKNQRKERALHTRRTCRNNHGIFFPHNDQSIAILPGESNHAIHVLSSPVSIITISEVRPGRTLVVSHLVSPKLPNSFRKVDLPRSMGLREGLFSRGLPQLRSAVNGRSPRRPRTPKESATARRGRAARRERTARSAHY